MLGLSILVKLSFVQRLTFFTVATILDVASLICGYEIVKAMLILFPSVKPDWLYSPMVRIRLINGFGAFGMPRVVLFNRPGVARVVLQTPSRV